MFVSDGNARELVANPFRRFGFQRILHDLVRTVVVIYTRLEIVQGFAAGLKDLQGFERIWLLYWLDRAAFERTGLLVKPYFDPQSLHRVFATRAPARPNPIGISPVRLVEVRGNVLRVCDIDILDGTPLLDIKPYVPQFDSFEIARIGWLEGRTDWRVVADSRFEK
jgi:tRNA-Thr(GGU) m(6)t(6)A37 methyltransferase TsaA